jgi:glycosyltransferase involved in cell wall biosynthesis
LCGAGTAQSGLPPFYIGGLMAKDEETWVADGSRRTIRGAIDERVATSMAVHMRPPARIRVAIVSPCFGTLGGIETFVCGLAKELNLHPDLEVTLCFKKTANFKLNPPLEKVARDTGANVAFIGRASRELAQIIRNVDIVHCQNPCFDVAMLTKLLRKKLVLTMHNQRHRSLRPREVARLIAWNMADQRWYNSEFNWDTWDPTRKKPNSARFHVLLNLPTGIVPPAERKGFVFVARWIANKGIDFLVEAYARAQIDRKRWPLILMGDGPLRPKIEAKICDEKIEGIQILGFVSEEERNEAIRYARWMVTPPNNKEDLGVTPIEARHVAVPCIITRTGGLPEAGGRHALSCAPGNVSELQALLEKAAGMTLEEYEKLCEATHKELLEYLSPLSEYVELCKQLVDWKREDCS